MIQNRKWMISFFLIVFIITGCNSDTNTVTNENEENETAVYPVEVEEVNKGILSNEFHITGTVMAEKISPVIPMLAGEAINVHVENGDEVKKGDVLLEIDSSDIDLNVSQARAGLEAAEANLRSVKSMREQAIKQAEIQVEQAEKAYEMLSAASIDDEVDFEQIPEELHEIFEKLLMSNMPTEHDIAQAEAAVEQAKLALEQAKGTEQMEAAEAAVKQAEIAVKMAEKQQSNAIVTAPISGYVTNFSTKVGELVSPQVPLMQIVSMDDPVVHLNVNEMMLSHFEEDQKLDVYIPSIKETFEGTVTYISLMPGEQSRSYPIEVTLTSDDDHRLKVGMVAEIMLETDKTDEQVIIPVRAVTEDNNESYVFVTKDGKTVEQRLIKIGNETTDYFEVISGLEEGEYIVINGQHQLYDGAQITVQNEDINFSE